MNWLPPVWGDHYVAVPLRSPDEARHALNPGQLLGAARTTLAFHPGYLLNRPPNAFLSSFRDARGRTSRFAT